MLILVVNLARRPDRLAFMAAQLDALDLPFERIAAIDARSDAVGADTPTLTAAERACALSHRKAWQHFLASGRPHCLILEDDVILSPALKPFLDDPSNIPIDVDLLRLETRLTRARLDLPGRQCRPDGFRIHQMRSVHLGAAAYVVSRAFAEAAARDFTDFKLPIDEVLFSVEADYFYPNAAYQLYPALGIQADVFKPTSDSAVAQSDLDGIRAERGRAPSPRRSFLVRCLREIGRIPRNINARVTRRAWRDIPFAGPVGPAAVAVPSPRPG